MRRGLVFALVAGLAAALAVPALAVPPVRTTVSQQDTLTNPTACGSYGVEWRINTTQSSGGGGRERAITRTFVPTGVRL